MQHDRPRALFRDLDEAGSIRAKKIKLLCLLGRRETPSVWDTLMRRSRGAGYDDRLLTEVTLTTAPPTAVAADWTTRRDTSARQTPRQLTLGS